MYNNKELNLIRIAKKIADTGYCSRRKAEKLILENKVKINGKTVNQFNICITKSDVITINNHFLPKKDKLRLWKFYKQKGFIVTDSDPLNRPTVRNEIKKLINTRLIFVGRLDFNSEGLLLLTNDGSFSRKLELPRNNLIRTYKVRVFGNVNEQKLDSLKKGIIINKIKYRKMHTKIIRKQKSNTWIEIKITEGKNREIRKVMSYFGYSVNRLIRTSYGPFNLKNMMPGTLEEIKKEELNNFLKNIYENC